MSYNLHFILVLFFCTLLISVPLHGQEKRKVFLDADTANEIDDLYAISRALIEPSWEITTLSAAHWQTSLWAEPQSMELSHRINNVLVGHLGLPIKTRRGAPARMYDWGYQARHSAAAYEIINQVKELPEGEKLTVVSLGALTNIASAVYIEPSIASKIVSYSYGTGYDPDQDLITITDFNCMMDMQALFYMFNSDVEMHIMPGQLGALMEFEYATLETELRGTHTLGDYLVDRWYNHLDGLRKKRWIWDLSLIGAMIHAESSNEIEVMTPKNMGARTVFYYSEIDADKIMTDFYDTMTQYLKELKP